MIAAKSSWYDDCQSGVLTRNDQRKRLGEWTMRFLITGADKQTGNERTIEIEAENEQAALEIAKTEHIFPYKVQQIAPDETRYDEPEPRPIIPDGTKHHTGHRPDRLGVAFAAGEPILMAMSHDKLGRIIPIAKKWKVWAAWATIALVVIALVAEMKRGYDEVDNFGETIKQAGEKARADFKAKIAAPDKTVHVRVMYSDFQPDSGAVVLLFPVGIKKTMPSRGLAPAVAELELETVRESWRAVSGDVGITDGKGMVTFTNLSGGKFRLIVISKNGNVNSARNNIGENIKLLELYLDDPRLALEYAISHEEFPVYFTMRSDEHRIVLIR